jgi:hypothetical protein
MNVVRIFVCAVICLFAGGTIAQARPIPTPRETPAEKPIRLIAIIVNDTPLETDTPPRVIGGRVLLPMRDVFNALGIVIESSGGRIFARLPTGSVTCNVDSSYATIDGRTVSLGTPIVEVGGTVYVPLELLVVAFGVQASYDQRGAKVDLISDYVGRESGAEQARADGGSDVQGVISAIDLDSQPPSLTVVRGGTSRSISITSDAKIWTEDVTIHSQLRGQLSDVRVGDAVHAILQRDGRVISVFDFYKSTSGSIVAVSPSAIVLDSGRVVTPSGNTEIQLNSNDARLGDLHPGDFVTVRSNPESGELRQIVASRTVAAQAAAATATPAPGSPGPATIASVATSLTRPLRAGESFAVTMHATPGGHASFDIGDYLTDQPMRETAPGFYAGRFTIPDRFNLTQVPIYATLSIGASTAPRVQAAETLSAATTPPAIGEVEPSPGQTVNNVRPSIFATYSAPTDIPINLSSITLEVGGHDVTASSLRLGTFVNYSPGVDLPSGPVTVTVRVSDSAGNFATKTWTFTIQTR